ncbi:hypothetical protein MUN77_13955 [Leucobacter allii]|uniref:hypothetical protein n=1 Tax=Leucobacter allii TaxID=2932247 RepID=UPI001FD0A8D2|nr:hypothetical protein [Leucobacter allii]UOR01221.1 hypothetical protein MUN77_13955 [Leucobacter allii]
MARALGLTNLAASRTFVVPPAGLDAARTGTAIDFRARMAIGGFDPNDSTAAQGVMMMPALAADSENGAHRTRVLTEAFEFATQIVEGSPSEQELDCASFLLAHCEQVFRAGIAALDGALGDALDATNDGVSFALHIDEPALSDLRALMEVNARQLDKWRASVGDGERTNLNPAFVGSALVGGADADWIVGDTLFESKAYAKVSVPTLRSFLRQLLGYVMLDLEDALHIRRVGVWLPRQGVTRTWSLSHLLGGDPEEILPKLRDGFRAATSGLQLAIHEPVTQRRKHQLLADNMHTPGRMLAELACSEEIDLRFRVARNPVTPGATVRALAEDRYARVREGVAKNTKAPSDVLHKLRRDRSISVRRAVRENPLSADGKGVAGREMLQRQETTRATAPTVKQALESSAVMTRETAKRDPESLNTVWFREFLLVSRNGSGRVPRAEIPVPFASRRWAWQEGRSLGLPEWLKTGLPESVKHDLLSEDCPAWVRRYVADTLPIANPRIRDALLADSDPEIRWAALGRTVDHPDSALADLLDDLAKSREERTRFRTEGDGLSRWERGCTPAERDRETLALIASHPSTPYPALEDFLSSKSPELLIALAQNPSLKKVDLDALLARVRVIRSSEVRERLAASPKLTRSAAAVLVTDRAHVVRAALARNHATPVEVLDALANDVEPYVRLAVAANMASPTDLVAHVIEPLLLSNADSDLLEALDTLSRRADYSPPSHLLQDALDRLSKSRMRDPDVRYLVARHEGASAATLARLSQSQDESVRSSVAANTNTPTEILTTLASDTDQSVRAAAASNEKLNSAVLTALAFDTEAGVRASAAKSSQLDAETLRMLLRDDDRRVRTAAYHNPATAAEDKAIIAAEWKKAAAASAPSRQDLEERAANTRAEVRIEVAYDSRTSPDILALLAGERRSVKVRRAAAANPHTSGDVLASLVDDADAEVRQSVAFNSSTPAHVLSHLAERGTDLALIVALNPDAPTDVLEHLATDPESLVKYAAVNSLRVRASEIENSTVAVLGLKPDSGDGQ